MAESKIGSNIYEIQGKNKGISHRNFDFKLSVVSNKYFNFRDMKRIEYPIFFIIVAL